jgi:UDP-glucose 4-epimerase
MLPRGGVSERAVPGECRDHTVGNAVARGPDRVDVGREQARSISTSSGREYVSAMSRVVVTGCAGMIGSHLVDALLTDEHAAVVGIDDLSFGSTTNLAGVLGHPRFQFHQADVQDVEAIGRLCREAATIVHLAAVKKIGEKEPGARTLRVNTHGTENVLEAAKAWGAKVVLASTSDVYGMAPVPHKEDGNLLLGPSTVKRWAYAVSKLYDEQLAFAYHKDEGVPVVVLRYFGGFSPRSSTSWSGGHIPIFIDALLRDAPITIHGDGSQTRSMAHVADLVRGTIAAMKAKAAVGEIINLGNDEEVSVLDSARLIRDVVEEVTGLKRELRLEFVPMQRLFGGYTEIPRRVPDLSKARRLLDYAPRYTFREAVAETVKARYAVLQREDGLHS